MLRQFFCAPFVLQRIWAWLGLFIFIGHQAFRAYISWRLNGWYESFYDMLQSSIEMVYLTNHTKISDLNPPSDWGSGAYISDTSHEWISGEEDERGSGAMVSCDFNDNLAKDLWECARQDVVVQLIEFVYIVTPSIFVHPIAGFLRNWWVFSWRVNLMSSYLKGYNLELPALEGSSQRIHEDTQRFASGVQGCVVIVLHSLFTLMVFCPTLYILDPLLMYVAIGIASGSVAISAIVGWPLVGLEVANQKVEAELRKRLVIVELQSTSSANVYSHCEHGQGDIFSHFVEVFKKLRKNYMSLYCSFAALGFWLSSYEQAMAITPYAIAGPRLFMQDPSKRITLGQLMKITNSFGRVFDSLNVISDNWLSINEFRSVVRRLHEFEREQDTHKTAAKRPIEVEISPVDITSTMSVETVR